MMGIVSWIVAAAGVVALSRLVPRRQRELWLEGLAGCLGGVVAGFLATAMDFGGVEVLDVRAIVFAALASAAAVAGVRLIRRRRAA